MLQFKLVLDLKFLNQFDFCFPLSQIMVMNTTQRKIKTGLKILNQKN